MSPDYTVTVHDPERAATFERIFGSATAPVRAPTPVLTALPGRGCALVYELDLDRLTREQRTRLIFYVAERFGHDAQRAAKQLHFLGMAILAEGCTVTQESSTMLPNTNPVPINAAPQLCERCGDTADTHAITVGPESHQFCTECIFDAMMVTEIGDACRICGCTDEHACEEGCFWSELPEICSRCAGRLAEIGAWHEAGRRGESDAQRQHSVAEQRGAERLTWLLATLGGSEGLSASDRGWTLQPEEAEV